MKMYSILSLAVMLLAPIGAMGQPKVHATAQRAASSTYPIDDYDEPRVGTAPDETAWAATAPGLNFSWAPRDTRFSLHKVPDIKTTDSTSVTVWKGERANLLAVVYSNTAQGKLTLSATALQREGTSAVAGAVSARFVNYIVTDDYASCGDHDMTYSQWLVPDVIDQDKPHDVPAMETRPVWCTVETPRDMASGSYTTSIEATDAQGTVAGRLKLTVNVVDRLLPETGKQKFHLDLWQQPYAVSRYYGTGQWTDEHLEALRPYLKALARAGQCTVSTILFYEPWGKQSHDKFEPMVETVKTADGAWKYDYTVFDKYVELCDECGINRQINCFSMVPWDMSFRYKDEATGSYKYLTTSTSASQYKELWNSFLTSFKAHLKEKGWFEKTNIAMDERGESDMLNAYAIASAQGFSMALAGNYHSSLCDKLQDYSVALGQASQFTDEQMQQRKQNNRVTTFYTSCSNPEPNIFTHSQTAEAAYLPLHAAACGIDGFLHWSFINWDEHPLTDSRFRMFEAGDTYCYYPGNRPSVRFERLIEGIQQYEKVQIMKDQYADNNIMTAKLNTLLSRFENANATGEECAKAVDAMEEFLNQSTEQTDTQEITGIQDLFNTSNGDGKVPPYRIPGLARTSSGRLIATAARLVCGTDPGFGQVDVVCRTSDDNGATWSEMKDVAVGTGVTSATENYFDTAFGDPAVVADRDSKEALIIAVGGCTLFTSENTTRQNPNLIALIRSHDNGETWEKPVDITEDIYTLFDDLDPMEAAFVAGGRIFQSRIVKVGDYYRLYAALCARPCGNKVVYSDDFGATWHVLGGSAARPAADGNEAKCDELPDGRVILSCRVSGGRVYNVFTYTDTGKGKGNWDTSVKCTFDGSGLTPGGNSTNGEMLVLPVKRNSDNAEMYIALQSIPTGSGRTDVGIYYKELNEVADCDGAAGLSAGWDGFFPVSDTSSAYSSMELQADGNIGFFWEQTLTSFGQRQNPVTTSFPTGSGTHNYDGFDNLYAALSMEQITGGAYSLKLDADRRAFLQRYFKAIGENADISAENKTLLNEAIEGLSEQPTTGEIDHIYNLLGSGEAADKWDGHVVTFTNVQYNGDEYALYIDSDNCLQASASSAASLGKSAEFDCVKRTDGKYSFYNKASEAYMIWRAGGNYGYNNNAGTLAAYAPTWCDWTVNDGSATREGTVWLLNKRANGTTDGTLILLSTGVFDSWMNSVAWSSGYSNLFRIDVVGDTDGIADIKMHADNADKSIYSLSGIRVSAPTRGVYVSEGKKTIY